MKKLILLISIAAAVLGCSPTRISRASLPGENLNFIVASDMGRKNGADQKKTARLMGQFADVNRVDFAAIAGDPIHDEGVQSVTDPEWNIRIENIYTAPSLHAFPWYVTSGNHEYHGSVQAIIDYSEVSGRWEAPSRYHSQVRTIPGTDKRALFVFLDTAPLIDKYRDDEEREYTDAGEQNMAAQLVWLERTLAESDADWKFVIGHHPVYAHTDKNPRERTDMQQRVGTILERTGVDFYISGHIHNFQHIKPAGRRVNYVVNSSASRSRKVGAVDGTIFCNPEPGFTAFTVSGDSVMFEFITDRGETVYQTTVRR